MNSEKKLTGRTLSALNACRERGSRLFVATARPPILGRMLGWTEEEQELFDGGVYCNGGCEVIGERMRYYFIPLRADQTAGQVGDEGKRRGRRWPMRLNG